MPGSNAHTLGPGHLFVRFRTAPGVSTGPGHYLGTCEIAAKIDAQHHLLKVLNDIRGRSAPFQKVEDGETHMVAAVINRFDYTIWKRVRDTYYHAEAITNHGRDDRHKNGSFNMGIGDFQLIHVHEFTGVAPTHPYVLPEQPAGRIYFSANLVAYVEDPSATRVQTIAAAFECDGLFDVTDRSFRVFSETPADFGSLGAIT